MNQSSYRKILKEKLEKNPFCTLEKAVYEILLESIVTFVIKPGTQLVEYQLADDFGISRSPVREALRILDEQGFVRKENSKKIVVEPLDIQEYNELIQFRYILEPAASGIASILMTEDELKQLKTYADLCNDAYKRGDIGVLFNYENLFHEYIIQCCHNRYIINSYKRIQPYLTRSRAAYLYLNKNIGPNICVEEHYLIYNSLLLRNRNLTENIVKQLLQILFLPSAEEKAAGKTIYRPYDMDKSQEMDILSELKTLRQNQDNKRE